MINENAINMLNRIRVTGRFIPYWIVVEPDKKDDMTELHWWIDEKALRNG